MTKILNFFKTIPSFFWWSLLSGIFVGTSYIPFNGWALFFCYIPLWVAVLQIYQQSSNYKKVFFSGWITQFTLSLIGFNWIYYVSSEFGHLHWSLSLGALMLFAGLMHLYIPLSLIISLRLFNHFKITKSASQLFIMALVLSLLERIWPSIFEWNLAYTLLWIKLPLYHWADTVGFFGVSTWILLFQAALAFALIEFKNNKIKSAFMGLSVFTFILLLTYTGSLKSQKWSVSDERLKIAVAQGNIGNAEKLLSEKKYQYHSYIRGIYTDLSTQHLANTPSDLMIWPETAMPFALDEYTHIRPEQATLLKSIQGWALPVITGGYAVNPKKLDHLGDRLSSNAIFYLSPNLGFSAPPYSKTNLLVFGEYLPFGEKFPFLYSLFPFVGVFDKGSGPVVAQIQLKEKTIKLGPQICYDSLDPAFSRDLAKNGAQILFNVTNDSWFGDWSEPFQHNIMTLARAIEVRRPLIRATNTGISSAILADGAQLQTSPISQTWAHTYEINYKTNPELTFYTTLGHYDWILWIFVLLVIIYVSNNKGEYVRSKKS